MTADFRSLRRRAGRRIGAAVLLALLATATPAEDVHSNGTGGGPWSDPASWRGRRVPGAEDAAVIARGDTILFDRDDSDRISIDQIAIDPRGTLAFRPGGGRMVLTLGGAIECYGTIRLDATKAPATDHQEIRFAGAKPEHRAIRLQSGGALVASGKDGLPEGKPNVVIAAQSLPAPQPPAAQVDKDGKPAPVPAPMNEIPAIVTAGANNSVDVQRAHFHCVVLKATGIDNTGAKNDERISLSNSLLTGLSQVNLVKCDSPVIAGNSFSFFADAPIMWAALVLERSPLAEIRGNTFSGGYRVALTATQQVDTTLVDNTFTGSSDIGVEWTDGTLMCKGNVARACRNGFVIRGASGVVEATIADGCSALGFDVSRSGVQFINTTVVNVPENAAAMQVDACSVPMLNCAVDPARIRVSKTGPVKDAKGVPQPWVVAQAYVVARVKGTPPAGARVEVATANPATPLPAGAIDMNVRNNFAPLNATGLTPLPRSQKCIILRTWSIGPDGTVVPPPTYTVNLCGPPPAPDAEEPVLKTVTVEPAAAWFRKDPADATPTLEIPYP